MKMMTLGRGGPVVSALGLGCMRMSNFPGSQASRNTNSEAESIATIHAALDAGINFLDTGDFYGMGHNEMLLGRAISDRRDDAFISVKFGAQKSPSGAFLGFDARPNSIKNFAAYSLQRLGVDVIDLYQPGRVDPAVPIEETVGAVADLIKEGKVRYLGLSETDAGQLRRAHRVHPVTALEIEYSLATRLIEPEILPAARELGVGIVAYSIVAQGLLTGDIKGSLPPNDGRGQLPRFQGENLVRNLDTVSHLQRMAADKHCTPSQLAIAWVLSRGEDIMALVGMSRRARLPDNLQTLDIRFNADELAELERVFAIGAIHGDRYPAQVQHLSPR